MVKLPTCSVRVVEHFMGLVSARLNFSRKMKIFCAFHVSCSTIPSIKLFGKLAADWFQPFDSGIGCTMLSQPHYPP
jgi:hypothetical protein